MQIFQLIDNVRTIAMPGPMKHSRKALQEMGQDKELKVSSQVICAVQMRGYLEN